ncbi:MAG: anti-sigma factor family protein [Bacillota bacterium]
MNCENNRHLDAYYDGELFGEDLARFEAHLSECLPCRTELQELQKLSELISRVEIPSIPSETMDRLHDYAEMSGEMTVLRIAEWLTAAAAAILVVGLLVLFWERPSYAQSVTAWEQVVINRQVDGQGNGTVEPLQMAEWVARGLASENSHD